MKKEKTTDWIISGILALLFFGLSFTPLFKVGEHKVYDLFLTLKPSLAERPDITMLTIDDSTIVALKMYPLTRDFIADSLVTMTELGARSVLIDSEFREESPRGVWEAYLQTEIPELFGQEMSVFSVNMIETLQALTDGRISLKELKELLPQFSQMSAETEARLLEAVRKVVKDYDELLGRAGRLHGQTYVTVTAPGVGFKIKPEEAAKNYTIVEIPDWQRVIEATAVKNIRVMESSPFTAYSKVNPAIYPIIKGMVGAGNVEQVLDADGVNRRVDLLFQYGDRFYAHQGLAAVLREMGDPQVEIYRNKVILRQASHLGAPPQDISIPLDDQGRMLIHWVDQKFAESFRSISFFDLYRYEFDLRDIIRNLRILDDRGALSLYQGDLPLLELWHQAELAREEAMDTGSQEARQSFREIRDFFINEASAYVNSEALKVLEAQIVELSRTTGLSEEEKGVWQDVQEVFEATKKALGELVVLRQKIKGAVENALVVIGYTGQSTTDLGVTPFETDYANMGTYANEVNTILQGNFLWEGPVWLSFLLALPLAFLFPLLFLNLSPMKAFISGMGLLLGLEVAYFGVFTLAGGYLQGFLPATWLFTSLLVSMIISFRQTNAQKTFIQGAFGQYLSKSVIDELISNPERLKLGGEKKVLTALFTDVKGFSTISEQMDAEDLVVLLNEYLTGLSDIILEAQGTVDKYEGDAIMAFFGAPTDLPDHAVRACKAAVDMKRLEGELNKKFLERKMTPSPLLTRIGLNTGDMVVGNMGTEKKKNYTIMGNHVNLAARLEGVNKQYGTWMLISENTRELIGDTFLIRTLDRVRVVGINTPIRLYELLELRELSTSLQVKTVEAFEKALKVFEERRYSEALDLFKKVLEVNPQDAPGKIYLQRCQEYLETPPEADWDGVYNLTSK